MPAPAAWRAFCLAAAVVLPGTSAGESIAVIAVSESPDPVAELVSLTQLLREALQQRSPGVLSADDTASRLGIGRSLAQLDAAHDAALATSRHGDYESAARVLREIVAELESADGVDGAFPRWSRATLRLAWMEHSLGRKAESRQLLERLVRAEPDTYADPLLFPPTFVRSVEEARSAERDRPRRVVRVVTGEPQALVYVEGRLMGMGTAAFKLSPGRYRVTAVVRNARLPTVPLDVGPDDVTLPVNTRVTAMPILSRRGPGLVASPAELQDRVAALAPGLRVDRIVSVRLEGAAERRAVVAGAYDARTSRILEQGRLKLGAAGPDPGGIDALAALLTGGASSALVERVIPEGRRASEGPTEPAPRRAYVLHYYRPDGKYGGWGLHTWNPEGGHRDVTWYKPRKPAGKDDFGIYWSIPVEDCEGDQVNYIIHRGERKEQCGQDKSWRIRDSTQAWVVAGDCRVYLSKEEALRSPRAK